MSCGTLSCQSTPSPTPIGTPIPTAKYYVAPNGSDSNPGTEAKPFATWEKLSGLLLPGELAYIRGGTYKSSHNSNAGIHNLLSNFTGTAAAPIRIWAYPAEKPVLDF